MKVFPPFLLVLVVLTMGIRGQGHLNGTRHIPQGDTLLLNCTEGATDSTLGFTYWNERPPTWVLPSSQNVLAGWKDHELNRELTTDGMLLSIKQMEYDFYGTYQCIVSLYDERQILFKHHLKYLYDLPTHYSMAANIGGAAAGGFFAVIVVVFLVNKFRWVRQVEPYYVSRTTEFTNPTFVENTQKVNRAFSVDDDILADIEFMDDDVPKNPAFDGNKRGSNRSYQY